MKDLLYLGILWLLYFIIHSCLASLAVKQIVSRIWPESDRIYRLLYNFFSIILLIPIGWFLVTHPGQVLWQWNGVFRSIQFLVTLCVLFGFYWSTKAYNMKTFLGLQQWSNQNMDDPLGFSGLHRYVRHPWYTLVLIYIWTRDMDSLFLLSAILMTSYFWVGSILEERKLLAYYGSAYKTYMNKVPGLIPRPGKALSKDEAFEIDQAANKEKNKGASD